MENINETKQSNDPIIRFLDDSMVENIQNLKEAAMENGKSIKELQQTLIKAQIRISELLQQTYE